MNRRVGSRGLVLAALGGPAVAVAAALFAAVTLSNGGCDIDRSGFGLSADSSLTALGVRPQIICLGESVNVSWQAVARTIGVDDCGGESTGVICAGVRTLEAIVFLTASPTDFFALPENRVATSETSGSRTVMPEADTTFTLVAGYEDIGFVTPRTASVRVIRPDDPPVRRTETFVWGCTSAGGAAGWGALDYERGEVATDRVRIVSVRNLSGYPISLLVNRPDMIPSVAYFEFFEGLTETDAFNGEYYGLWSASPLVPAAFTYPDCSSGAGTGGAVDMVPGVPPVSPPAAVPNIVIEVTVSCAEGGI